METGQLERRIRLWLILFMVGLVVSGITAIPLTWESGLLDRLFGKGTAVEAIMPWLSEWISFIHQGLESASRDYPFINYGTDWLAFAHIVIAIAFIGPLRDPVRNIWVVEFGMIACVLIIPTALVFGALRGIPLFWQAIDCSFGVLGIVPLFMAHREIRRLIPPTNAADLGQARELSEAKA